MGVKMDRKIAKKLKKFNHNVAYYEKKVNDKEKFLLNLKNKIKEYTILYFSSPNEVDKQHILEVLSDYYDMLYYINSQENERRTYLLDDDIDELPTIFVLDQRPKRFDIDESLLSNLDIENGLTEEQAQELLKLIVNNTRDNLNKSSCYKDDDVYENDSLLGACGFSQFSSLFPLQKLGLHITINNIWDIGGCLHAYGTVVIPVNINGNIIPKRYLVDCTYRQFFTIPFNVVTRYKSALLRYINEEPSRKVLSTPHPGFFIVDDVEESNFAKELLQNGFVEASIDNLKKYLKPFYSMSYDYNETNRIDKSFSQVDILDILENRQTTFDYTEEEFLKAGFNLYLCK